MSWLVELLPLFVVRWLAARNCKRYSRVDPGYEYTCPRPGVWIEHEALTKDRRESREPPRNTPLRGT